jgi:polysaccharide biosynthesis transport protein
MKNYERTRPTASAPAVEEKHLMDYLRIVYKRRWISLPVFIILFAIGAVNALRQTPIYQAHVQLLIEKDAPSVATLDQMFQSNEGWYNDEFYQTQYKILQSRSLAKRAIDMMNLWDVPKLGNGPEPKSQISITGFLWSGVDFVLALAKKPLNGNEPPPAATVEPSQQIPADGETPRQAGRIDQFLSGVSIAPVRNSRLVEVRYTSNDPVFAAAAANGLTKAYIQQSMEQKFNTSKEATDWLGERLAEQRKAVEASEAALQAYRERNGAVSVADNAASNIVVGRLTDLNSALTKAKTERINKEALYTQLKAMESTSAIDTFPAVLANEYIQKLKTDVSDLQRQQAQMAERYGERHAEMIRVRTALQGAEAKLRLELGKVVESVRSEYQTALNEERSLQSALDAQKGEAMSLNRKGIEYGVLQREADSNRQIYDSLLQRTKVTDISSERRSTNIRIIDQAEVPRGAISPNIRRDVMVAFGGSLFFALALAFVFEYLDSRIKSPQELKAHINVPFLGMVPVIRMKGAKNDPLLTDDVPANFAEAFKTIRTNVLFSSADEGMRSLVVTSAGPGEGKSITSANIAIALAQTGQRVLLIDCDMRRPRVHEIFGGDQEPGLSNVLTGNAKPGDAIRRSHLNGLWLLASGHIPPNPAELLGSRKFADFMISLEQHFDWVVLDTPPVLVVADSSIVANQSSGVVFVVGSDKTSRHAAKAAVEQLESANAHIVGSILNRVDLVRNPYYYSAYYRKEYSKYYVSSH